MDRITQIQFELTTKCNARCPQCIRNYYGSYTWPTLPIVDLEFKHIVSTLTPEICADLEHIRFCGTYGDPCMHRDLIPIISWIKNNTNAEITINTNGSIRSPVWWTKLANILDPTKDRVFWGIDGLEDTNHLYRIGTSWTKITKNLQAFNRAGGNSVWAYLIFEHNQDQVEQARQLSLAIGCREFVSKSTSRFVDKKHNLVNQTPVLNSQGTPIYFLRPPTLPKYQNQGYKDFINTSEQHTSYQHYLTSTKIDCDSERKYYVYISAEGDVFPCGWLADRLYGFEPEQHQDHITILNLIGLVGGRDKINIKHSTLEGIISGDWFKLLKDARTKNMIHRCAHMCGDESTLIKYANSEMHKLGLSNKV